MDQVIIDALERTQAFSDEDLEILAEAERDGYGPITNWNDGQFKELFGATGVAKALVAQQTVSLIKVGEAEDIAAVAARIPEFPPYLERGLDGKPVGYDPHDPAQFWTDPSSREMYRWDGKGRGRVTPLDRWPYGQAHRVVLVEHRRAPNGVLIPDEQQAHDANNRGYDWFHRGYNVWIGNGGKPYGDVPSDVRDRFRLAQASLPNDGALVLRPPRVA